MLSGSEKEPEGGDRNGGGNGLGGRFAKSAKPVSKWKGSLGQEDSVGGGSISSVAPGASPEDVELRRRNEGGHGVE